MAATPRVLTVRLKPDALSTSVIIEHGSAELERKISSKEGVTRMSFIFDSRGNLWDVELVTMKIEE